MPQRRTIEVKIEGQNASQPAFRSLNRDLMGVQQTAALSSKALNGVLAALSLPSRALGGLMQNLAVFGLAAQGMQALIQSALRLTDVLGLGLNMQMEDTEARFLALTKSAEQTAEILQKIRREADQTPFEFPDMAQAAASLIPAARLANESLMDLLKTAEILAAARPDQGLVGAAFSLREAVGGDFTSIIERFDLPRQRLNQLKEEGVPALEAVRKVMTELGYDAGLVANVAGTLRGRWSTFLDTLGSIRMALSKPLFEVVKAGLETLQKRFDDNRDSIMAWAERTGAAIGRFAQMVFDGLDRIIVNLPTIVAALDSLGRAWQTVFGGMVAVAQQAGQLIYGALQWMNPYATHSPSLVEQVRSGAAEIAALYQGLPQAIAPSLAEMEEGLARLNKQMAAGIGGEKGAAAFSKMLQQQEYALRSAELALVPFERALERQKRLVAELGAAFQKAEADLRSFQTAPLAGERRFDDALFGISQSMARLRLEQLDMEEKGIGGLSPAAKRQYGQRRRQIEADLKRLGRAQERTQLQRQLTIDPQRRALEQVGQTPEISFQEAMRGAQDAFRRIQELGPAFKAAQDQTAKMEDDLRGQRDILQQQRDLLDPIRMKYEQIAAAIAAAKSAAQGGPLGGGGPLKIGGDSGTKGFYEPPGAWSEVRPNPQLMAFQGTVDGIAKSVRFALDTVTTFFAALQGEWEPGEGVAKFHLMVGNLGLTLKDIGDRLGPVLKETGEIAKMVLDGDISGAIGRLADRLKDAWPGIQAGLARLGEGLVEWVKPAAANLLTELGNAYQRLQRWGEEQAPVFAKKMLAEFLPAFVGWVVPAGARLIIDLNKWVYTDLVPKTIKFGLSMGAAIAEGLGLGLINIGVMITNAIMDQLSKISIPLPGGGVWRPFDGNGWKPLPLITTTPPATTPPATDLPPPTPTPGPPAYVQPPPPRGRGRAYAFGGQFQVGGMGGSDSQWTGFWATPGETVTITPPGQEATPVAVHIDFGGVSVRNDADLRRLEAMIAAIPDQIQAAQFEGFQRAKTRGARRPAGLAYSAF